MCNCACVCCWVSKNAYLAKFPEAVHVKRSYLPGGLIFTRFGVPANDQKEDIDVALSVMGHVETHGSLPRFSPRQMLVPARLWTCATRKNKNDELICFPTSNEQSSINPAIVGTAKQKLAWNATMEPHADARISLCWDIWDTFLYSLRLTSCHVVFEAQYITQFLHDPVWYKPVSRLFVCSFRPSWKVFRSLVADYFSQATSSVAGLYTLNYMTCRSLGMCQTPVHTNGVKRCLLCSLPNKINTQGQYNYFQLFELATVARGLKGRIYFLRD